MCSMANRCTCALSPSCCTLTAPSTRLVHCLLSLSLSSSPRRLAVDSGEKRDTESCLCLRAQPVRDAARQTVSQVVEPAEESPYETAPHSRRNACPGVSHCSPLTVPALSLSPFLTLAGNISPGNDVAALSGGGREGRHTPCPLLPSLSLSLFSPCGCGTAAVLL